MRRFSERVDGYEMRPYTIHRALVDHACSFCKEEIVVGDLFIPFKDRGGKLGEIDEVYSYCWGCFPNHPKSDEDWSIG